MDNLASFINARAEKLFFYLPYPFISEMDVAGQMEESVLKGLQHVEQDAQQQIISVTAATEEHLFLIKHLPWDSEFFGRPVYKLFSVLFNHQNYQILTKAVSDFKKQFFSSSHQYCFIEIPSEDILLMQALNANGFILVETRLAYYRTVADFTNERFAVRKAAPADIDSIRTVAATMHNPYDRFHAEPAFSPALADAFLSKYAEEAVKGYCDVVIVPGETNVPAGAFLALSHIKYDSHPYLHKLAKIVLTAVAPACKGWHYKLVSEAIYLAQAATATYIFMTTQATNKAIIHNCEKLGFNLGSSRHILSYTNPPEIET